MGLNNIDIVTNLTGKIILKPEPPEAEPLRDTALRLRNSGGTWQNFQLRTTLPNINFLSVSSFVWHLNNLFLKSRIIHVPRNWTRIWFAMQLTVTINVVTSDFIFSSLWGSVTDPDGFFPEPDPDLNKFGANFNQNKCLQSLFIKQQV
jgi:hypothetical protein